MEVRQLEAFAEGAAELHFWRAAEKPHMRRPALSGLIRHPERDGARAFFRIRRKVKLTSADSELLAHSKIILDDFAAVAAAVRAVALGEDGTVQEGIAGRKCPRQPSPLAPARRPASTPP